LQFTSLLQNIRFSSFESLGIGKDLLISGPSDDVLSTLVGSQIPGKEIRSGGVVILDSLNMLQNMLWDDKTPEIASRVANHRSAVLLSLLSQFSSFYSKSLIIVNLTKARPKKIGDESILWEKEIVGGRMTRFYSDVLLFASISFEDDLGRSTYLEVTVGTQHESFPGNWGETYKVDARLPLA